MPPIFNSADRNRTRPQIAIGVLRRSYEAVCKRRRYLTRIPAHDIVEMHAKGDSIGVIVEAWQGLTLAQIDMTACYARAYPRRGHARIATAWRSRV